jgi:hypothetical protein
MTTPDPCIYVGRLEADGPVVYAIETDAVVSLEAVGGPFGWGADGGDATLELARVLLTDSAGSEPPADVCRRFARDVLGRVPNDGFAIHRETVNAWLRRVVPASR